MGGNWGSIAHLTAFSFSGKPISGLGRRLPRYQR